VHAVGDRRIVFTLTKPAPYFLAIAAIWVGVPVRATDVAAGPTWTEPATYIGNGPFKLVQWTHGERMVFERNERYRTAAKLKRWTKMMIPDHGLASAAFANDELDVISAAKGERATASVSTGFSFYLGFNLARPPFDDRDVRM